MGDRFFEDFAPGTRFESAAIMVTEVEIVEFARRYDPQFFHTDPAAARESAYGGLIASGFHTAALTFGLFLETGAFGWRPLRLARDALLRALRPPGAAPHARPAQECAGTCAPGSTIVRPPNP